MLVRQRRSNNLFLVHNKKEKKVREILKKWKVDPEVDRIEASLYRKVLRVGNMISNKAILNTMTSIRLAGEVVNYLSKGAWEQFRR